MQDDVKEVSDAADLNTQTTSRSTGMLDRLIYRMFSRQLTVMAVEPMTASFRLIRFQGESLCGVTWVPGQKVQLAMGSALAVRTYTPIDLDPVSGQMQVIAHVHGQGVGSQWAADVKPGDVCQIFGPSSSQDLGFATGRLLLVGDETSVGLSCAAAARHPTLSIQHLFETSSSAEMQQMLQNFPALGEVAVFERVPDQSHLDAMEAAIRSFAAQDEACIVLTGKAASIQRFRQALRQMNFPKKQLSTKAFWATGKKGLD